MDNLTPKHPLYQKKANSFLPSNPLKYFQVLKTVKCYKCQETIFYALLILQLTYNFSVAEHATSKLTFKQLLPSYFPHLLASRPPVSHNFPKYLKLPPPLNFIILTIPKGDSCSNLPWEEFSSESITQYYFTETITKGFYKKQESQKHNSLFSKITSSYYAALSTRSTYTLTITKIPSTGSSKICYLSKYKKPRYFS